MSITATQAAAELQRQSDSISPYKVISLLLDGALERIDQAKASWEDNRAADGNVLISKVIGIVSGLRASLDMDKGGEVAVNLDGLYEYIAMRLAHHDAVDRITVLNEASRLLMEVKAGWDGIADHITVAAAG